jgi:hypothetical protein
MSRVRAEVKEPIYKEKAHHFWIKVYFLFNVDIFEIDPSFEEVICRQMLSLFTAFRQNLNQSGGGVYQKYMDSKTISVKRRGVPVEWNPKVLMASIVSIKEEIYGGEDASAWMGTLSQVFCLVVGWGSRYAETKYTPDGFTVEKVKDGKGGKMIPFDVLGVSPSFRQMCAGASWPVALRSSLAQSLGPMTQVTLLAQASGNKYGNKWVEAVTRTFAHIPQIGQIAMILKEKNWSEVQGIVHLLCLITGIQGDRAQKRIMFPPGALIHYLTKEIRDDAMETQDASNSAAPPVAPEVPVPVQEIKYFKRNANGDSVPAVWKLALDKRTIESHDFSGIGAWKAWNSISTGVIFFGVGSADLLGQLLLHSCLGSFNEDMGILELMFDISGWKFRHELSEIIQENKTSKPITSGARIDYRLPNAVYVSKMSSSLQTNLAPKVSKIATGMFNISGRREVVISESFAELLNGGTSVATVTTVAEGEKVLEARLEALKEKLGGAKAGTKYQAGNSDWYKMTDILQKKSFGECPSQNIYARCRNQVFWGQ